MLNYDNKIKNLQDRKAFWNPLIVRFWGGVVAEHIPKGFCVLEVCKMKALELTGQKFGRLTVVARIEQSEFGHLLWWCLCECGEYVIVLGYHLKNADTKSCGCLQRDIVRTHGKRYMPEYNVWSSMKDRCTNFNNVDYKNYGGRGIIFCEKWLKFENFFADMGPKPSCKHTIERILNNGNYEPTNCIWATQTIQSHNMRVRKDNNTGYRGINWDKIKKKYRVRIGNDYKRLNLGHFIVLQDAIIARKAGELKYWGKVSNA